MGEGKKCLKRMKYDPWKYSKDVDRIVKAFRESDIELDRYSAFRAWQDYSHSLAASWLLVPEEGERIVSIMMPYLVEILD